MPSRRTRKVLREGTTDAGTINRGGQFWQDFPGDSLCTCGHLLNRHIKELSDYGICIEFTDGAFCLCKKFEEKK